MPPRRSKRAIAQELNTRIEATVKRYNDGEFNSIKSASVSCNIPYGTLWRHINGGKSRQEARSTQQALTTEQEAIIVKWIKRLTATRYAPDYRLVRQIANEIRLKRLRIFGQVEYTEGVYTQDSTSLLGRNWVYRFV
jgi:hypothetical protein